MHTVDGHDVEQAVAEMVRILSPHDLMDWQVPAGSLNWNCWTTAAHVAHDLLAYAGQLTAHPTTAYLPLDLAIATDASRREVLQVVTACGGLLSSALAAASPQTRAWHWGLCDPAGFAAMGVAETLLHTHDITQDLRVPWLLHHHYARPCSAACSPMHHPVTLSRSSSGPLDEQTSTATPASPRGDGKLPTPEAVSPSRCPTSRTSSGQPPS